MLPFVPKGLLYRDQAEKTATEERNGVILAEMVISRASEWGATSQLTPELFKEAQQLAVNQIYRCAGHFRDGPVSIQGVPHAPPQHEQVPALVTEMCEYVNGNWAVASAIHLSSYVMWRMNWIHPFFGGNGRTSRAISYLVLSAKLGFTIPGEKTIPEMIVENRAPYYSALRKADVAWSTGSVDVSDMEEVMASLLARQLLRVHELATGKKL